MTRVRNPFRRLVVRAVTLGLLSAFVAESALPAVVAAWGPEPGVALRVVDGRNSHHGSTDHHHPGCPWRGQGPCPHQKAAESAPGPVLTACADTPAAASDGAVFHRLAGGPVFDWCLRLKESRGSSNRFWIDPPAFHPSPDTPPPRSLPAL